MKLVLLAAALLVMLIGTPIGYLLGIVSVGGLLELGGPAFLRIVAARFYSGVENFLLIAIPFFILTAELMNRAGLTQRLVRFVGTLVGHYPGGLSHVNIGANIIFAGMSGAAVTDAVALGKILIPEMKREGYSAPYAAAVTAAAAIVGPIIPPSVTMIVYAYITQMSVGALFAAGVVPGLTMGALLLVTSAILAVRRGFPRRERRASAAEVWQATRDALLALVIPLIILGSILGGVATVTESAAVAVGYTFLVGMFVLRTLSWRDLIPAAVDTAKLTGVIFLLLGTAHIFGWYLTRLGVPRLVSESIFGGTMGPVATLLLVNAFLLVIGMFMDILPAVLILTPVLAPAAVAAGIDPLHFALIMLVNLNIGMITPPFGMTLLTSARIAETSYDRTVVAVWPFLLAELATLLLITFIPALTLGIPGWLGFH